MKTYDWLFLIDCALSSSLNFLSLSFSHERHGQQNRQNWDWHKNLILLHFWKDSLKFFFHNRFFLFNIKSCTKKPLFLDRSQFHFSLKLIYYFSKQFRWLWISIEGHQPLRHVQLNIILLVRLPPSIPLPKIRFFFQWFAAGPPSTIDLKHNHPLFT
jgi:hypothetical protein